jgi:di/tricarboxylate transporter
MELDAYSWIAIATLVGATVLFLTKWLPIPVTALGIPVVLFATHVVDADQALRGFSSKAALAIAAVFVLGAGLRESGLATVTARALHRIGGRNEGWLVALLMLSCGLLSAFMSNAAVVAILLPVGLALADRAGVAPSRLLIPLAFAAVLGGTITLIGTAPNLIVGGYVHRAGLDRSAGVQLHVFDFAPVGLAILGTGTLFMVFVGRRLLPVVRREDRLATLPLPVETARTFDVADKLFALSVPDECGVGGKTIAQANLRGRYGLAIVVMHRRRSMPPRWLEPQPTRVLRAGDVLYVQGDEVQAWALCEDEGLQFGLADDKTVQSILRHGATLAEIALPPHSRALGRTARELKFQERFGLNVLAVQRGRALLEADAAEVELELGDAFLVSGSVDKIHRLTDLPDFILLTDISQQEDATRAPLALLLLFAAVIPPILVNVPIAISAMGAALLMYVTGCVSRRAVRRCVDWNVLFRIVGTIPLGVALDQHHVARFAGDWISHVGGSLGAMGVLSLLFLLATVLAVLTSNAAAAVITAPVAVHTALAFGIDVREALMVMAYGCSCVFLLPFAQCNLLVVAPGGYRTADFVRVGALMSLVMAVTTIVCFAFV